MICLLSGFVGMSVITDAYRIEQKALHENPFYGVASKHYAPLVSEIIKKLGISSLTDYGAGKKRLFQSLVDIGIDLKEYNPYDPAFPEYGKPMPAQLVCCIDVLEHVELDCLDDVLSEIHANMQNYCFLTVHTGPAMKHLSDGRNAHITQAPSSWWLKKLTDYFEVLQLQTTTKFGKGFWIIGSKKNGALKVNSHEKFNAPAATK